jgi:hypothetical protein
LVADVKYRSVTMLVTMVDVTDPAFQRATTVATPELGKPS